jgi:hypothetical protein
MFVGVGSLTSFFQSAANGKRLAKSSSCVVRYDEAFPPKLSVPNRIVVALLPEFSLYGFGGMNGRFPELL